MAQKLSSLSGNLERRAVVSVLLFPFHPYASKPYRLLLFRRSNKVSTYRKKLAPIAGSIEVDDKTPLDAAWRELGEETGLGPQHIELWRRGPGFEFTDEKAVSGSDGTSVKKGRIWTVHPFAFRMKQEFVDQNNNVDTSVMHLDWEHFNCEWNNVDDILSGKILDDCVPRLEITLGQVWIEPGSLLHQAVEELRLDHVHGARELATMAVKSLIKMVESDQQASENDSPEDITRWWESFRLKAFHLAVNARPSMGAAISSAVVTALQDVKTHINEGEQGVLHKVKESLERNVTKRGEISKRVCEQFSTFLQEKLRGQAESSKDKGSIKVLTLSSSSTIKAAILHALDANPTLKIELRILESRPLCEGVGFAKALTDEAEKRRSGQATGPTFHDRLRVVVATDASVGLLSREVDLVLVGADRISESGDVSNKTGSLPAVLTCKHITNGSANVVCISEAEKIAPPGAASEHPEEDNDQREVVSGWNLSATSPLWNEMVGVRNIYFEWIPAKYVDYYVCEDGALSTEEIQQRSKQISELTAEVFPVFKVDDFHG
ncbi:hypothetical protein A1O1_09207 [Capronia coronata CBS 617.96]|uniref:Nudix hydrolase domain-containing protein n=1 Tax=Capronia coronata CBS 617.96 TaxID=1182541 RepID=W9XNA0_9EURO|nr:uncharacterized protein A1O1_09207 [Capronia coronata CBS 617.96]EXJ78805.1 hypothetical protein A1O1_09207 [Capronia coronata CBS 617.96]